MAFVTHIVFCVGGSNTPPFYIGHTAHFFRSLDQYSTLRGSHMTNIEHLGSHMINIEHFSLEYVESHNQVYHMQLYSINACTAMPHMALNIHQL